MNSMEAMRKKRIFDIMQIGFDEDWQSRVFDIGLMFMILLNLFIAVFATFEEAIPYLGIMETVEQITMVIFGIEYGMRLWTAEYLYPKLSRSKAVRRYMLSFNGVIDLLAFLPYFLPIFFPTGVVAFRMFRVIRIFRLFRVNAYYDALNVIGEVLNNKKNQILSSVFIIGVLMLASSLWMYSLEHEAQPDVFRNAFSGLWWSVSTLLTVGYGDIYPVTMMGRVFGIIIAFLGVGLVAIPTGIISAGFVEQYTKMKSFSDLSSEEELRFVHLKITDMHPWYGKCVRELPVPPGLLIAVIQRNGEVLVPHGDTRLESEDDIVLGAEGFQGHKDLILKEMILRKDHPWIGLKIRDLDISRQSLIVMVRRNGKLLLPDGSLILQEEDMIVLYTRKVYRNMQSVEV